nr:thermostable beta-galactosidase [uncultured bacterium]
MAFPNEHGDYNPAEQLRIWQGDYETYIPWNFHEPKKGQSMHYDKLLYGNLSSGFHGAYYNPEQWPCAKELWEEDAKLMKEDGWNLVSLGHFSWEHLEPDGGRFMFGWLDEAISPLIKSGEGSYLGTEGATPPAWLMFKYPDKLWENWAGRHVATGGRQHYCKGNPYRIKEARRIVRALAERYWENWEVLTRHVENEYWFDYWSGCACPRCAQAFRYWLKGRYSTIDALNAEWSTRFWEQRYPIWLEANKPESDLSKYKLSQELDYYRFAIVDERIQLFHELEILRTWAPDLPVTLFKDLNAWQWAEVLDHISWDSYPKVEHIVPLSMEDIGQAYGYTLYRNNDEMFHDLNRSFIKVQPFSVKMEQQTSPVNWFLVKRRGPPGVMRLWSAKALARGADVLSYFQWRSPTDPREQFHGAGPHHRDLSNTRLFRDFEELGEGLDVLEDPAGAEAQAEVALIFDWEVNWAYELAHPQNKAEWSYAPLVEAFYPKLMKRGLPMDFVELSADLTGYDFLGYPMLYMVKEQLPEALEQFVEREGRLYHEILSGVKTENDLVFLGAPPGPLRQLAGTMVERFVALPETERVLPRETDGEPAGLAGHYPLTEWAEWVELEGAEPLLTFGGDYYAGLPDGKGHCYRKGRVIVYRVIVYAAAVYEEHEG